MCTKMAAADWSVALGVFRASSRRLAPHPAERERGRAAGPAPEDLPSDHHVTCKPSMRRMPA